MKMITTTQQATQFNFPALSGLAENGKSWLSSASISTQNQVSSRFEVVSSEFNYTFTFEIMKVAGSLESNNIVLYLKFSKNLILKTTLSGYWTQQEEQNFYLQKFNIEVEKRDETSISVFLLSTFWAILSLSRSVRFSIPDFDYSFTNSFELPINDISVFLQERQIAYQLMVIEQALEISLPFPDGFIDGKDIENIAFCYHAIFEREFDWFCDTLTFFPPSTTDYVDLLPSTNTPFPLTFPTPDEKRVIFRHSLNLRQLFIKIKQAIVVNYEEAKKNLLVLDGKLVEVIIKSVNGKMRYAAINVPTLPKNAFSKDIKKLIDLDLQLDSILLDKYFALAASTLDSLSEEQKAAITERPILDKEAFIF